MTTLRGSHYVCTDFSFVPTARGYDFCLFDSYQPGAPMGHYRYENEKFQDRGFKFGNLKQQCRQIVLVGLAPAFVDTKGWDPIDNCNKYSRRNHPDFASASACAFAFIHKVMPL